MPNSIFNLVAAVGVGLLLVASIGCGPSTRMPNLFDPGNAASQQYDAIYHDPYPLDDIGTPVEGGRPRAYSTSVPQVVRDRLNVNAPISRVAPPGS